MNHQHSSRYRDADADSSSDVQLSRGGADKVADSEHRDLCNVQPQEPIRTSAGAIGGEVADEAAGESHLECREIDSVLLAQMTVAKFVEHKFAPEHINRKRYPSRLFYQAILKHIIGPEEVQRIFQTNSTDPRRRLMEILDWPYLTEILLCDVRHDHVSRIASAAKENGYSIETVRHIRNVIGTIFSHAIQEKCFFGENPISLVTPIRRSLKQDQTLTPDVAKSALNLMRYPERELTFIGAISGMSPAEIIGLQWGQINMMEEECSRDGIRIPPMTIAIRKRWYRGRLDQVTKTSFRDLEIDPRLLQVLMELRMRSRFTQPNDFVLVSHFGTPISHDNIMTQRLRPIAKRLGVPSVSSRVFRQTQGILTSELDRTSPFRSRVTYQGIVATTPCEA